MARYYDTANRLTAGGAGGLSTSVREMRLMARCAHRKKVRHYHEPGDCHELTFSGYRRMPLRTTDVWPRMRAEILHRAMRGHEFHRVAFVLMPEPVHLLV